MGDPLISREGIGPSISRRLALGSALFMGGSLLAPWAWALGRIPYGGRLRIKVPWPVGGLDPHDLSDPLAALFGNAVAEPLYALDAQGRPYPALAQELPRVTREGTQISLRPQLQSGRGKELDARDLLFSLERARQGAAAGILAPFLLPVRDPRDGLSVLFKDAEPEALARALTSSATSLVPRGFSPRAPDGTGAFLGEPGASRLVLNRNLKAARGAAFLDRIEVFPALDLADALRSFEAGETELGWLGSGLHRPRPNVTEFNAGRYGFAVLRSGAESGPWGAPGVAQRLLDGIDGAQLSHLGLSELPGAPSGSATPWGGPPAELLVDEAAPQLVEIARVLGAVLSSPNHQITVAVKPAQELSRRRQSGQYSLMVDFVRSLGNSPRELLLSLLTAANPALARTPPKGNVSSPRELGQTLPLGVIGELRAAGALVRGVGGFSLQALGSAYWIPKGG